MRIQSVLVLVVLCGTALVRGTPVYANADIIPWLTMDQRCLFICNICFDKNINLMGTCANSLCPKIEAQFVAVNLWISKRCDGYESLAAAFFPKGSPAQA